MNDNLLNLEDILDDLITLAVVYEAAIIAAERRRK